MVGKRLRSDKERDPIAKLARMIAQANPPEENAPSGNRFREETVLDGYDETPELPSAPQLPVDLNDMQTRKTLAKLTRQHRYQYPYHRYGYRYLDWTIDRSAPQWTGARARWSRLCGSLAGFIGNPPKVLAFNSVIGETGLKMERQGRCLPHGEPMRCDHRRKSFGLILHRYFRMRFCSADCLSAYQCRPDDLTIIKIHSRDLRAAGASTLVAVQALSAFESNLRLFTETSRRPAIG
jgi:hypothetical protein